MKHLRRRWRVAVLLLIVPVTFTGCRSVFDAFVPPHPNSRKDSPEVICVRLRPTPPDPAQIRAKALPAIAVVGATVLAGFAVDQFAQAIEREAKRYKASYSGRYASYLLLVQRGSPSETVSAFSGQIVVARYYDASPCPSDLVADVSRAIAYGSTAMRFVANIEISEAQTVPGTGRLAAALRIVPQEFALRFTKAKVSTFNGKADVAVQVTLSTFVADEKGAIHQADIAKADFPLGKIKLPSDGDEVVFRGDQLKHLTSGWHPLPAFKTPLVEASGDGPWKVGLLNLSATVIEADDLGDVIAKGAKTVADSREKLIAELLKALGLTEGDKK